MAETIRFCMPCSTYLVRSSPDDPNRRVVGRLGSRRPTLSVPSTFYGGEGFPPPTGNVEFPKSGPRKGRPIVPESIHPCKRSWDAFIPPLKHVGFRLAFCKACENPMTWAASRVQYGRLLR